MNSVQLLLLAVFAAALVIGAAAQASHFCLQGGLREAVSRHGGSRLAAYVFAVGSAVLFVGLLQSVFGQAIHPSRPAYTGADFLWGRYLAGGLLFGAGMMLARACPLRTLVHVGQGSLQSVAVLIVMAAAAYAMSRTDLYANVFASWLGAWSVDLRKWGFSHQDLGTLLGLASPGARLALSLAIAAALLIGAGRHLPWRSHKGKMLGAAAIGAAVAAGYAITAGPLGEKAAEEASFMPLPPDGLGVQSFTFSGPLGDAVYFLLHPSAQTLSFGVMAVAGALLGAWSSAVLRREFNWRAGIEPRVLVRRCIGAAMVGGGAVLGLGCTIGHGLSGLSVLSAGSLFGMAAILAGAWIALKAEGWFGRQAMAMGTAKRPA